jgi:hypothetical protein
MIARAVRDAPVHYRDTMLHWLPWRVGDGENLHIVFACVDPEDVPGVNDVIVAEAISPVVAAEVVSAHNRALAEVDDA